MTIAPNEGLKLVASSIIVSDLEKSARFYSEGLGFKRGATGEQVGEPGGDLGKLVGTPDGCRYRITILTRPEINIALSQFLEPAIMSAYLREPANRIGRGTIMLFNCPDARATAERLVELGGEIYYDGQTHVVVEGGRPSTFIVTDPDGFRIQLVTTPVDLKAHLENQ